MATFIYQCPTTGMKIQGWIADEADSETNDDAYQALTCLACQQAHFVNPKTGKVLSANND